MEMYARLREVNNAMLYKQKFSEKYEKYDESPEIKIFNGDILFVKTGSTLGKSALVTGLKEDFRLSNQ